MSKKRILIIYTLLTVACFLAFWQVSHCDFVSLDDEAYVTGNSHIRDGLTLGGITWAFTTGHAANWHPLTWISHMVDVQLFGLNPHGHHVMNLLFHIANTALLFFVLHRMTRTLWQSAFVAALFALHPLHVESVAWVAERKDVLSTFFWMLTMCAYCYYVERQSPRRYLPVLIFFALGLMAKPMLVTLPFVLLLLDYWPLLRFAPGKSAEIIETTSGKSMVPDKQKERSGKKDTARKEAAATKRSPDSKRRRTVLPALLREKIPLFALALLSSVVTYLVQQKWGAVQSAGILPLSIRVENAFVSYVTYIGKMIWPHNLAVYYPYQLWPSWQVLGAVLFFIAMTLIVIMAARRYRYLIVGWLWYVGTLVPVIGFVQVGGQSRADRYTYIPLIGLFIMAAWAIPERMGKWRYRKPVLVPLSAVVLLCFFTITILQVKYWQNNFTLFDHALKVTDNNYVAIYNRGDAYAALGNYEQALKDYDWAIGINPKPPATYYSRGNACAALGNYEQALKDYDRAIGIEPNYAPVHANRGNAYAALGNYEQALKDYDRAIGIEPNYAPLYANRGNAYAALGNYEQALKDYDRAIGIDPHYARAYHTRGAAYYDQGSYDKSISDYGKAIERDPKDEYSRIMLLLALRKVSKERAASSMDALRSYVNANTSMKWIRTIAKYYLRMGGLTETRVLEEAQHGKTDKEIRERLCEAYYYLGEERLWKGDREGAQEFFQKSVETNEYRFDEYRVSKAMLTKMGNHKN